MSELGDRATVKKVLFGSRTRCFDCTGSKRHVVVRSRNGGFVTQNCESCGAPHSLSFGDLPACKCHCGTDYAPCKTLMGNYAYTCPSCNAIVELHTLVPHWNELFDYHGFGLDTDDITALPEELRRRLSK